MKTVDPPFPELSESAESNPPMKTPLELAQDELQAMCDRAQALRRKMWFAADEIQKAVFKGQLIEVVKQLTIRRLDLAAEGINVAVKFSDVGCPIRVSKECRKEFYE